MQDDIQSNASEAQDDLLSNEEQNLDVGNSSYAASREFVPDPFRPGGSIFEGGNRVATITPNQAIPGGYHVHSLGNVQSTDMESVLDSFHFDMEDVRTPWGESVIRHDTHEMIGSPELDKGYWEQQTTNFTCAVQAQRGIIEQFTGQNVSEAQLTYEATVNGWLTDRGMSPSDAGNLLELHGIDCHSRTGATIEDLMAELSQGHKVIVGVDSGEMWRDDSSLEDFFHQSADHAIWVTGVDMTDPAHPKVLINDSGDPNGAGKAYDLQTFANAWQDSGFFYVATTNAPQDMSFAAGRGVDAATGVFPELVSYFGNLYDDFRNHLQDRLDDQTQITPTETPALLTDATVRAFIQNLPKSPMVSFNESATDNLFRIV